LLLLVSWVGFAYISSISNGASGAIVRGQLNENFEYGKTFKYDY
jgi:hypothetical protein